MAKKKGCLGCLGIIVIGIVLLLIMGSFASKDDSSTTATSSTKTKQNAKEEPKVKTYKAGQYKVGTDLPAGEYVALTKGDAYLEVAKDSKGTFESIIVNDVFMNRSMITVSDGQYLKLQNATLYAAKDAPKVEPKDGFWPSGMYKVGVDIPAGEYKVITDGDGSYIEVSSSSKHTFDSIISNDVFEGDKYVTIQDGQYVKFFGAKIQAK